MKNIWFRCLPYGVSIIVAAGLFILGMELKNGFQGLLINISAAFFAIPLIYLFYQIARNYSSRRLNKEIFEYVKEQVDREVLSILEQTKKMVFPYENTGISKDDIGKLLSMAPSDLGKIISKTEYLGFQIFKHWEVYEQNLDRILQNTNVVNRLQEEQVIALIKLVKSLVWLERFPNKESVYKPITKKADGFRVIKGTEINKENIRFPNRYLLLKDSKGSDYLVQDFGDFHEYDKEKLLGIFVVNKELCANYTEAIYNVLSTIKKWLEKTGYEFIIDIRQYRTIPSERRK